MGIISKQYGRTSGTKGSATFLVSFETGEQAAYPAYFNGPVTVTGFKSVVTKALGATDTGTITGANATGASAGGVATHTASAPQGEVQTVTVTSNNSVAAGSYYKLTTAKTTAGGKAIVTVFYVTA